MTKLDPLEEEMAIHSSILAWANLTDSMKRQKDMTLEDETRSESVQNATGKEQRTITNSSKKNEVTGPKQK